MFTSLGSRVVVKKKPITVIATSGNGLTLSTSFFTADQRNSSKKKRLIVPAGVTLGAAVTGVMNGAFEIIILGNVDGLGGTASVSTASPGGNGGDAIRFDMDNVTVKVRGGGNLRGGGGGGGKGGAGSSTTTENRSYPGSYYNWNTSGSSYAVLWDGVSVSSGGGNPTTVYVAPWTYAPTGSNLASPPDYHYSVQRTQPVATTSGAAGRGQGYDGAKSNGVAGGTNSGLSGNGGDWGSAGTNGAAGNAGSGSNAGLAGKAANFNGRLGCSVANEGGTILGVAA
jgi:hypothetical protein